MRRGAARRRFLTCLSIATIFILALIVAPAFLAGATRARPIRASRCRLPARTGSHWAATRSDATCWRGQSQAAQESIVLGFGVVAIILLVGTAVGLAAGYFGGAVDYVLSKVVTAFQAFPSFVLAVAIAGILGQGIANMVIAIAAVYWTQYARLVRRDHAGFQDFGVVKNAARMCGAGTPALMRKYLLPQILGPVAILSAVSMSDIILTMAGLSFIGLGPERPTNEWGSMMAESQASFQYAIWCMLVPMAALFIAVVIFNLLGDTLRDALDIRSQDIQRR